MFKQIFIHLIQYSGRSNRRKDKDDFHDKIKLIMSSLIENSELKPFGCFMPELFSGKLPTPAGEKILKPDPCSNTFSGLMGGRSKVVFDNKELQFINKGSYDADKRHRALVFELMDQQSRGKILSIMEHTQPGNLDFIFTQFADIYETALDATKNISGSFKKQIPDGLLPIILKKLLKQAFEFFFIGNDAIIMEYNRYPLNDSMLPEIARFIHHKTEEFKADTELFKSMFHALYEEGVLTDFSEVAGLELEVKSADELSENDRSSMRTIYDENYSESAGYAQQFRDKIFLGLEDSFRQNSSRFYVLKRDGQVIGYNRFENLPPTETGKPRKYIGSFNIAKKYRGSRLGNKMFTDCLAQETKNGSVIEASADPAVSISSHYLERDGFTASGIELMADRPLLKIELDTEKNKRLLSKRFAGFTRERIREFAERRESPREYLLFQKFASPSALKFPEGGWLMTHYFIEKDGSCYAVFERDPAVRNAHLEQVPKKAA